MSEIEKCGTYFNWDALREQYHARIRWEIEQGLNPPEAFIVDDSYEKPARRRASRQTYQPKSTNTGGQRKYDHDEIMRLYYDEKMTGREVAERVGCNPATVYLALRKAKEADNG